MVYLTWGRQFDHAVRSRAIDLAIKEYGAGDIERTLKAEYPDHQTPGIRWIKQLKALLKRRESEPWDFAAADPDESRAVLPVMAKAAEETLGRVRGLTNAEAAFVWRIRTAVPDIGEWESYALARQFQAAEQPEQTDPLVWYLAFAPWRDQGARYARAYANGWVEHRFFLIGDQFYRYETPAEATNAAKPAQPQRARRQSRDHGKEKT